MTEPEDAFEKELFPAIERLIEQDYPNPNRGGCPGRDVLEKAAAAPAGLNEDETRVILDHVLKCWPCFKELKNLRRTRAH